MIRTIQYTRNAPPVTTRDTRDTPPSQGKSHHALFELLPFFSLFFLVLNPNPAKQNALLDLVISSKASFLFRHFLFRPLTTVLVRYYQLIHPFYLFPPLQTSFFLSFVFG